MFAIFGQVSCLEVVSISRVHFMSSSLTLQIGVITIEEVGWRWMGINIAFFTRGVAATTAKASTCTFSVRGILLIAYSFN